MTNTIDISPVEEKKGFYRLAINGVKLGEWETSQLSHLVQTIDNAI